MKKEPSRQTLVIFDFDGVIADTFALARATDSLIHRPLPLDDYRAQYERNIYELVAKQEVADPTVNERYFAHFAPKMYDCPVFPGVADAIHVLSQRNELVIVTSNRAEFVSRYLALHGLEGRFSQILGEEVERSKVKKLQQLSRIDRPELFITDTLGDVLEAEHVGLATIAVTWGYHERWRLEKGHPAAIIDSPWELVPTVESLLNATTREVSEYTPGV